MHGGASPQAELGGQVELARRDATAMGRPLVIAPHEAILQCIRIAAGEIAYASEKISELDESEIVAPVRRTLARKHPDGQTSSEIRQDELRLNVWVMVRRDAMDRLVAYSAAALRAGVQERLVRVAESQAQQLATAIRGILEELGVQDRPDAPQIVRRHLMLLAGTPDADAYPEVA